MGKVLTVENKPELYMKLADEKVEKEDYISALGFLFKAAEQTNDCEVYARIADVYSDMGLLEYSNKYWFRYMSVAPVNKVSFAYEELAVNYFYMDNLWASGYYFHLKLSTDGFIAKEGLDEEILDFFSGEEIKKSSYRVVYPHDKADYSIELKNGKRAIALGGFSDAYNILSTIPEDMRTEEIAGDICVSLFMDDRLDEAADIARKSIALNGDNITAYCNLSTIYDMKEDYEKSEYYYRKALELQKGDSSEVYKLATCAIERADHETALKCLDGILDERPYDITMRFFRGLTKANLGNYDGSIADLKYSLRADPKDFITRFYIDIVNKIASGDIESQRFLPFKYIKELPQRVADRYSKIISDLSMHVENIKSFIKKDSNVDILKWGMCFGDDRTMRESVYIMSLAGEKFFYKMATDVLLDIDGKEHLKRLLVYAMIVKGYKKKINVVAGSFFISVKPKKLKCENDPDGILYFSAYALCMSRMIFFDIENFDVLAQTADKIFKKLKGVITEAEVTNEEIAGLILKESRIKKYSDDKQVTAIFDITAKKLKILDNLYKSKDK